MAFVLLIDDDDLVRASITAQLTHAGHKVVSASHGGGGLKLLSTMAPDIVATDIVMPEVEGIEFIVQARKQNLSFPIIVITGAPFQKHTSKGASGPDYMKMAIEFGATKALAKPFLPGQLMALIDECTRAK